jgi:hypothetical protein
MAPDTIQKDTVRLFDNPLTKGKVFQHIFRIAHGPAVIQYLVYILSLVRGEFSLIFLRFKLQYFTHCGLRPLNTGRKHRFLRG